MLLRQDWEASWASFHGSRTADASSPWSSSGASPSLVPRAAKVGLPDEATDTALEAISVTLRLCVETSAL